MRCIITTEGFGEMVFELYPEHAMTVWPGAGL